MKECLFSASPKEARATVKGEKWLGKTIRERWEDENLNQKACFSWLHLWKKAPTDVIVGLQELYQQLLPTKVFYHRKTGTALSGDERCMCGKVTERVSHILAG